MAAPFLDALRATAAACEAAETVFRRDSQARLQALTASRIAAYRRYHLLRGMAEAAAAAAPETAAAAAADFALAETGWSEADAAYAEVGEHLAAAAAALPADAAVAAFAAFEAWYRDRFGSAFLDLLARDPAFLPVVDF